ncbi:FecCD family ABC transporter permease [Paenibacillus sp. SN-8-1]|uniref:FecCD family ABC transporter permease n=1 Tax=Paenibacillus sp. SN-8-1 TaxID=3435409 RepID=UPI003D9A20D5
MNKLLISQAESRRRARGIVVMLTLSILILIMFLISMNLGQIRLTPSEVLQTIIGRGTPKQNLILFEFRLPQIIISVMVGAGLALSGCLLQGVTGNSLAEPGILGINSGAGLAVLIFVYLYPAELLGSVYLMPVLALVGAGASAGLIYYLAYKKGDGLSAIRLVLSGIGVAAGVNAFTIVISLKLDPQNHQLIYTWLAGSIRGTDWTYVLSFIPWLLILVPYSLYKAKVLNVLTLGDSAAKGLGTAVNRERFKLMAVAVALAGVCVAVGGAISFVGLISPHLARRLVGPKHQLLLPTSMLCGGFLMILADAVTRVSSVSIPIGVVVAVIGAPYFLYLLAKAK